MFSRHQRRERRWDGGRTNVPIVGFEDVVAAAGSLVSEDLAASADERDSSTGNAAERVHTARR
jgi:hypothetical protein